MVGQLVQILTGHTHLKRHQAVIDESERQRTLEALQWDNADENGDAIIDAADPICSRCGVGEETPLHLLSECTKLAKLRHDIFGRHDLVGPREVPDFSDIPAYQLIAFFKEAKFETLSMQPFRAQYLPTHTGDEESSQSLEKDKIEADTEAKKWMSKYLFHIPLKKGRKANKAQEEEEEAGSDADKNDDEIYNDERKRIKNGTSQELDKFQLTPPENITQ